MAGVAPQMVYVPGYFKDDGSYVQGYWRSNRAARRLPRLKHARTFRGPAFKAAQGGR
jgi:hypothetical protein